MVVVADLHQGQTPISSNLYYLVSTKKIVLSVAHIESTVTQAKNRI
jgi:hypothetical protein